MMGRDLSRALDPVLLASDCGITCDEWQARALRERHKRSIWLCSRQCGKTTTAAIMALHTVLYEPPALDFPTGFGAIWGFRTDASLKRR